MCHCFLFLFFLVATEEVWLPSVGKFPKFSQEVWEWKSQFLISTNFDVAALGICYCSSKRYPLLRHHTDPTRPQILKRLETQGVQPRITTRTDIQKLDMFATGASCTRQAGKAGLQTSRISCFCLFPRYLIVIPRFMSFYLYGISPLFSIEIISYL